MRNRLLSLAASFVLCAGFITHMNLRGKKEVQKSIAIPVHPKGSEAIIIFVGAEKEDTLDKAGDNTHRQNYCAYVQKNIEQLQENFKKQNVPCYIIGEADKGFTISQAQKDLAHLINTYDYSHVTILMMCHGGIQNLVDPSHHTVDDVSRLLALDNVFHTVQLSYNRKANERFSSLPVKDFFQNLSAGELIKAGAKHGFEKIDGLMGMCYAGSVKQSEANTLPTGSTVIALCAANEEARKSTVFSLGRALDSTCAREGIDALDLCRMMLYHSAQISETDMMIYISGQKEKISLKKSAQDFYEDEKPFELFISDSNFVTDKIQHYKSQELKGLFRYSKDKKIVSYDECIQDYQAILQGFVLDKMMMFPEEPARLTRYHGYGIK